jgi:hypothetical protein
MPKATTNLLLAIAAFTSGYSLLSRPTPACWCGPKILSRLKIEQRIDMSA